MEVGADLRARIEVWDMLSRWERSELGRDLRRLGLSYGEIMDLIPVKKSTLATWCRDVRLTDEQIEAVQDRTGQREGVPRDTNRKRREEIERIRSTARAQVPALIEQPLWVAGTVLYWAEGAKTRSQLRLANSDASALRLFVQWVRVYLATDARFSIQLHLHEGNDEPTAQNFWVEETGLSEANFYRTFIKPQGTGHRKNHLPHGICTIKVRECSNLWHTTMAWVEGLADRLGLDEPSRYS
jgi:hypothetical protein